MYNYSSYGTETATAFFAAIIVVAIVVLAIAIPLYILLSLGLMKLAQNRGIENAWLAWIPFANFYILGKIVKDVDIGTININKLEIVLPVAIIANGMLGSIPLIGWIFSIAFIVLDIFVFIKLYKMYAPQNYVLYTVLSCLGLFSIMIFIIRNNMPVEVPTVGKPIFGPKQYYYPPNQQPPYGQPQQPYQQPVYQQPEAPVQEQPAAQPEPPVEGQQ